MFFWEHGVISMSTSHGSDDLCRIVGLNWVRNSGFLHARDARLEQVCVQPRSSARLSTWHCPHLLLSAVLRRCCCLTPGASYRSISPVRRALSTCRCCCRTAGQSDGQTDARPFRRPCYGGSANNVQEAQLSPNDRAMRLVSSNLANYHAAVQKLLIRQVMTKPTVWSWRFSWRQCVINKPTTVELCSLYHLYTDDLLWRNFLSPQCRNCSPDPDHAHLGNTHSSQD